MLLHAAATVEVNELLSAVGEVTVTTHRIRFQPNRMEHLVGLAVAFEDLTAEITGFGISGFRHRLEVRTATRSTRFLGDVVPALYAALQSIAEVATGKVEWAEIDFAVWPASVCRGLVMHPGALVQTATQIAFLASGLLDSLAGVQSLSETPLMAISTVALTGRIDQRIEVAAGGVRTTYACSEAARRYEQLVGWLAMRAPGPVLGVGAPLTEPLRAEIEAVLLPWRAAHPLPDPQAFTPAVGLSADSPATPGYLLVGLEAAIWLPGRAFDPSRPPVSLPLGRERWIWDEPGADVRAERDGIPYRWVTKAGAPFRAALFDQVERIRKRIALAWASSGTGVIADGQNRRDSYRVQVLDHRQPPISIRVAVDGEFRLLSCRLIELSLGGCSIRTTAQLPADLLTRVDLTEGGRTCSVRASVTYTRQGMHDQRWVAGLVFIDPPSDFDTVLRHVWMTLQQQQLRRLRGDVDTT